MRALVSCIIAVVFASATVARAGASAEASQTPDHPNLQVVSALYGKAGAAHPFEFSDRLQQTCGEHALACESFCSRAQIGASRPGLHMPFGARNICRVVYRCGDELTRAMETDEGDLIVLSCKRR